MEGNGKYIEKVVKRLFIEMFNFFFFLVLSLVKY